jgi:hypothetical protein
LGANAGDPGLHRLGDELRFVVRVDVAGHTAQDEQVGQHVDVVRRLELACDPDRQALARKLIDHVEHPELAPVMGARFDKVVGPDVIAVLRPQSQARAVPIPDAATLGLPGRDLHPLAPPDPLHPLVVDPPAGRLQQGADLPIAVAAVLLSQRDEVAGQRGFVVYAPRYLTLCRAVLPERPAGPTLGYLHRLDDVLDTCTAARGAGQFPRAASCRISLSRVRSAIALRSRWFSTSKSFIRRT